MILKRENESKWIVEFIQGINEHNLKGKTLTKRNPYGVGNGEEIT